MTAFNCIECGKLCYDHKVCNACAAKKPELCICCDCGEFIKECICNQSEGGKS